MGDRVVVRICCTCSRWGRRYISISSVYDLSIQKHAYSNILKILSPKNENFKIKNSEIFRISAQNIDCGYSLELPQRGSSNE